MFAFSIIKDLDVLEYCLQGVLRALETLMVDQLRFDDAEKGFGHGIIPAVTFTAHALNETMLYQHLSKILAGILNAAIRVDDQPGTRTTITDAASKGRKHHFSAQRTTQRPADHHAGEQVNKDRQVKPATRCGNVRLSRPRGFHPQPLREPDVNLSAHPAPTTQALGHASKLPMCEEPRVHLGQTPQIFPRSLFMKCKAFVFTTHPAHKIPIDVAPDAAQR